MQELIRAGHQSSLVWLRLGECLIGQGPTKSPTPNTHPHAESSSGQQGRADSAEPAVQQHLGTLQRHSTDSAEAVQEAPDGSQLQGAEESVPQHDDRLEWAVQCLRTAIFMEESKSEAADEGVGTEEVSSEGRPASSNG